MVKLVNLEALERQLVHVRHCIHTHTHTHRLIAMMSPEDSWVAKWQRLGEYTSNPLKLTPHLAGAAILPSLLWTICEHTTYFQYPKIVAAVKETLIHPWLI